MGALLTAAILAGLAISNGGVPAFAGAGDPRSAPSPAAEPDFRRLVERVAIPFERFTLENGLQVVVHENREAPVVGVSVWYNVGSKDEPPGQTGLAHLFEHIMFNGSENAPGEYFQYMTEMGATGLNGATSFDRTNYFETIPTSALERALFLESDRMGHLLGAVTEQTLASQIGVVQNEKRQRDNRPFAPVADAQLKALFPEGHPYRHLPIGSREDLAAADLDLVHDWFRSNYGPNNAIIALAGDLNADEARILVERYFGHIAPGPDHVPASADLPTLSSRLDETISDRVPATRLYRTWAVPGLADPDIVPLQLGAEILGSLASSRLDNVLVRGEQKVVRASAKVEPFQRVSLFEVMVDVKPGVDVEATSRRLDEIVADFIENGPDPDEVRRAVMRTMSANVLELEWVGRQAGTLAEGLLYADDPDFYRDRLQRLAATTPADVRSALQRWLGRPVYALRVEPGERRTAQELTAAANSGESAAGARPAAQDHMKAASMGNSAPPIRREMPPLQEIPGLGFPKVQRGRLSNGIEVVYAQRAALPFTRVMVEFDAGIAADPSERLGTQALMLALLTEGTDSLDSQGLAEAQEKLGAAIVAGATLDRTLVALTALTATLGPSLDLLANIIRAPAFASADVERLRQQQLAAISSELAEPQTIAARALPPLLYGSDHPYGKPFTGSGDPDVVRELSRDDLIRFHRAWIRPDSARIFAVGDLPFSELLPLLDLRFGEWTPPVEPRGTKSFKGLRISGGSKIILIDRPRSPQSHILGGQLLPVLGTQDVLPLMAANEALGGSFLARINMNLREEKGWSYGARGGPAQFEHQMPYIIRAPVQADRTADAIQEILKETEDFLTGHGIQPEELNRIVRSNMNQLAGRFESTNAVLDALHSNAVFRRPDDYWERIADRYEAMTAEELDKAARLTIDPEGFIWIVVGDAERIRPQLDKLSIPIEELEAR